MRQMADYNASTSGIDVSQSVGLGLGKKKESDDESAYKSSLTGTYTDSNMSMSTSLPNQGLYNKLKANNQADKMAAFQRLQQKYLAAGTGLGDVSSEDEDDSSDESKK